MKKNLFFGIGLMLIVTHNACDSQRLTTNSPTAQHESNSLRHIGDNSEVSLDWEGTYQGVLPCADCPGIKTVLSLTREGSYVLQTRYLDRGDSIYTDEGKFEWDPTGSRITLGGKGSDNYKFLVGENNLFQLDIDGNRITGKLADHYVLQKTDNDIRDIYWELIEINGQPLDDLKLMREPYLRLNTADRRVEANGGCNGMGGTYELDEKNNRLKFSQMMSTKMACENMEIEQQLADVMQRTDSYGLGNDTLQLFRARMAPLAKFRAVYIK